MTNTTTSPDFWPPAPDLQRIEMRVSFQGQDYIGQLVAPPVSVGPRPMVLVIHNFQGLKYFDVHVAEYLARVGYVGLAIDLWGDLVPPEERLVPAPEKIPEFHKKTMTALVTFDHDWAKFRGILKAWLDAGLAHPAVDTIFPPAAIGYCCGGMAVIECVRAGFHLGGVVSFHGLLQTGEDPSPAKRGVERPPLIPCEKHYNPDTIILIENGADDHLVSIENMTRFFAEMDEAGVDWIFHHHARTPHGFALSPSLGASSHYHEAADRRSTVSMLSLFREIFPGVSQNYVTPNAAGTAIPR